MSADLTKKAIEMLLKGATLVSEPCPYCKGVRVIKDGHALCVNCGKEPEIKANKSETMISEKKEFKSNSSSLDVLEKKLENLSKELEEEKNHEQQQHILKSINSLVEIIAKLKKRE